MDLDQLRKDIRTQGLEVILMSNPRNPTGQVVRGEELKELVELSRESGTTVILDEACEVSITPRLYTERTWLLIVLLMVYLP